MPRRTVVANHRRGETPSAELRGDVDLITIDASVTGILASAAALLKADTRIFVGKSGEDLFCLPEDTQQARQHLLAQIGLLDAYTKVVADADVERVYSLQQAGHFDDHSEWGDPAVYSVELFYSLPTLYDRIAITCSEILFRSVPGHTPCCTIFALDCRGQGTAPNIYLNSTQKILKALLYDAEREGDSTPESAIGESPVQKVVLDFEFPPSTFFKHTPHSESMLCLLLGASARFALIPNADGAPIGIISRAAHHTIVFLDTSGLEGSTHGNAPDLRQAIYACVGIRTCVTGLLVDMDPPRRSGAAPTATAGPLQKAVSGPRIGDAVSDVDASGRKREVLTPEHLAINETFATKGQTAATSQPSQDPRMPTSSPRPGPTIAEGTATEASVVLELTGKKVDIPSHAPGWEVIYFDDAKPTKVKMGHRTFLLLLAYVVSALRGEPGIQSTRPRIGGESIERYFKKRSVKAQQAPRGLVMRPFKDRGITKDIVRSTPMTQRKSKIRQYQLAVPVNQATIQKLLASRDPDVKGLLAFLPR